jgi:hypothetical protein
MFVLAGVLFFRKPPSDEAGEALTATEATSLIAEPPADQPESAA